MRDTKRFARYAIQKITFDRLGGGKGDGVHQAVQAIPLLGNFREKIVYLGILGYITGEDGF